MHTETKILYQNLLTLSIRPPLRPMGVHFTVPFGKFCKYNNIVNAFRAYIKILRSF